jgi:hypothetical protein
MNNQPSEEPKDPMFMMEVQFEKYEKYEKLAECVKELVEVNVRFASKIKDQGETIELLYAKYADTKALKKEIKLLKENLVNQSELIEEINSLKESIMNNSSTVNKKEEKIKQSREKALSELYDLVDEIISKQQTSRDDEDLKFVAVSKSSAIIVQAINTIMDYYNPKRMFMLSDIHYTLQNYIINTTGPYKDTRSAINFQPQELRRHEFLQNFINRLFNCGEKDGHRVTIKNVVPSFNSNTYNAMLMLTNQYIAKALKIIEIFVGELLEIHESEKETEDI